REVYLIYLNLVEPLYHRLVMRTLGFHQENIPTATLSTRERKSRRFLETREIDWMDLHRAEIEDWHRGVTPVTSDADSSEAYLRSYRGCHRNLLQMGRVPEV